MIDFESLAKKNGECTYGGKRYVLLRQAYADDEDGEMVYCAAAVCPDDVQDDMGLVPTYEVKWHPTEDFLTLCEEYADDGGCYHIDEGDACNWDNPDDVVRCGACTEDGRII